MDRDRIRREADERIALGYTRQHVFDALMLEHPEEKPKRVADIVRYRPSLMARRHYRLHHQVLLFAVVSSAVLQLAKPFVEGTLGEASPFRLISLLPLASIFLGIGVYRWKGETFQWLAIANLWGGAGLLVRLVQVVRGELDAWSTARYALALVIGVLALYLANRVFPKYRMEQAPAGGPARILFPPEPGLFPG